MAALIRTARLEDCEGIGAVHVAAWRETYRGIMPDAVLARLAVPDRANMWRGALERTPPASTVIIAESAGRRLVGFAAGGPRRGAELPQDAELYAIYIMRAAQKAGTGRRLVHALADALHGRGFGSLGLWVHRDNHAARGFYEYLGGVLVGERVATENGHRFVEVAYGWTDLAAVASNADQ